MSKFYTEIARYYDSIFPTGEEPVRLMEDLAGKPPKKILDVACGSGGYTKLLRDDGYTMTAIDLDESMVRNLKTKDPAIDAHVLNMLNIGQIGKTYDLIFCIGNSLVHLGGNDEIRSFLKACRSCLQPGGHLLLQIINYDRVLGQEIKGLSTIRNADAGLVFERYYTYLPDRHKVDFKTILTVDGNRYENHEILHPIRSAECEELLGQAGFGDIRFYGDFDLAPFDPQASVPLVITASAVG